MTRSEISKASAARRAADKALGIPSIASLAATLLASGGFASKAAARRAAVARIEALRVEHVTAHGHVTAVLATGPTTAFRTAMADGAARQLARRRDALRARLAAALHADKPWRSIDEARSEAGRRASASDDDMVAYLSGMRGPELLAATYGM